MLSLISFLFLKNTIQQDIIKHMSISICDDVQVCKNSTFYLLYADRQGHDLAETQAVKPGVAGAGLQTVLVLIKYVNKQLSS